MPRKVCEDRMPGESWLDMMDRTKPEREALKSEVEANARLIAAAPDLLEAVKAFIEYDDSAIQDGLEFILLYAKAQDLARAAITKATGCKS